MTISNATTTNETMVELTDTQARALDRFYQAAEQKGRATWADRHADIMARVEAAKADDDAAGVTFTPAERLDHLLPGRISRRRNIRSGQR